MEEREKLPDLGELATQDDGSDILAAWVEREIKRGVKAGIDSKLEEIATAQRITQEFPDLADPKTEFRQRTDATFQELLKDRLYTGLRPEALLQIAARAVEPEMYHGGEKKRAPGPDELSSYQKHVARRLGLSEDEYRKAAKEGIRTWGSLG